MNLVNLVVRNLVRCSSCESGETVSLGQLLRDPAFSGPTLTSWGQLALVK